MICDFMRIYILVFHQWKIFYDNRNQISGNNKWKSYHLKPQNHKYNIALLKPDTDITLFMVKYEVQLQKKFNLQ